MFQVIWLTTGRPVVVYGINGVRFLIWNDITEDPHWEWVWMTEFRPVTTDDMAEEYE